MSTTTNKAIMSRFWDELFSQEKVEIVSEIVSDTFQNHSDNPGELPGIAGLIGFVHSIHSAFPDIRIVPEMLLAEGDKVATRWRAIGTHIGEFMGVGPSGKQINFTGTSIHQLTDSKIIAGWDSWDTLTLLQQMGAIPA